MRLLVIEDEPELLQGLLRSLQEEGYAVDTASDGSEGLHKASSVDYDAILLDVMLPRLDGWTVLEKLRAQKNKTPVLLLTARDSITDRVRGLDAGADDFLPKPFDLPELFARIRALIRRCSNHPSSLIDLGDVSVDLAAKLVKKNGVTLAFTAREYSLVEFLALRRGEIVSRTTLYEHLFDESDDSLSNLLEVHVSNIRRKAGADLITTRRGMGYSIQR